MFRGLPWLISLVLLASAASHAQQPVPATTPQQPTFKANVNLVEVHAVVTNQRGEFVTGLSKEDFEIYEDGRPQSTAVFELMNMPAATVTTTATTSAIESDVRVSVPRFEGRLYVIVLDDLHTMALRSPQVKQAARTFIDKHLGAHDLAAIVYTSGRQDAAQELTSSRRLLRASIDRFQGQKPPSATAERLAVHFRERDLERPSDESSESGGRASGNPAANTRIDDPYDGERGMNARRALELMKDVALWMRDVNGRRKALVLFSEGIDYDIYDVFNNRSASGIVFDARDAIAAAQRANVAIYAVDPRGLTQLGDEQIAVGSLSPDATVSYGTSRDFQRELLLAQESLMWLAEDTGGIALVRDNDIARGLARIAEDNSRYYVLGYVADPQRSPGKFRNIEVRVKRPGLKVRSRRGYVPADAKAAANKRDATVKAGTSAALVAALNNPLPVGELPVRVFAAPLKGTGKQATVLLSVEVDTSNLPLEERDGRFINTLEVSMVAADHQGKVRDTERKELNLRLRPETRERLRAGGVRFVAGLHLPPSRYQIRIGVHESVRGLTSTVPYDIEVPDYDKTPFALSPLVLTSSAATALMTPEPDKELKSLFPVPPVATRVFGRSETLGAFAELYDTAAKVGETIDFKLAIQAGDGRTVYGATDSRTVNVVAATHGYRAEIPLRDLTPGSYVLRLEARPRGSDKVAVREIPFELNDTTPGPSNSNAAVPQERPINLR
jgi:VWFA-related protein